MEYSGFEPALIGGTGITWSNLTHYATVPAPQCSSSTEVLVLTAGGAPRCLPLPWLSLLLNKPLISLILTQVFFLPNSFLLSHFKFFCCFIDQGERGWFVCLPLSLSLSFHIQKNKYMYIYISTYLLVIYRYYIYFCLSTVCLKS